MGRSLACKVLHRFSKRNSSCCRARRSRTSRINSTTVPSNRREQLAKATVIESSARAFSDVRNEKTRGRFRRGPRVTQQLFSTLTLLHYTHLIIPRRCHLFSD